jgi:hypothetical protein
MSLTEHRLSKHFELPEGLDNADSVQLIHKLFLGLLKQEVLLVALGASVIADISHADASDRILKDVPHSVSEASTIQEGEEEAKDVEFLNVLLLLKVLRK